jgi:hypothetical protein
MDKTLTRYEGMECYGGEVGGFRFTISQINELLYVAEEYERFVTRNT